MIRELTLQNFRNYSKRSFEFGSGTTLIVGPNASGKTNILEAIYALATGKSFRTEKEIEVIKNGENVARIETDGLEIIWDSRERFQKLYRINGVGKRQADFVGNLRVVMFAPQDIEIIADSPSTRRKYLDLVLSLAHREYRVAIHIYDRALRQRNRLLWKVREFGEVALPAGRQGEFEYWDSLLIMNGKIIHGFRREYLNFLGFEYDHSIVSQERLKKYAMEEIASATTLVGPQRDDFRVLQKGRNLKSFGSRGEQRLAIFAMKLKELEYVEKVTREKPTLLLDDIFSELDHANRHQLLQVIPKQQTIMTTTDLHLIEKAAINNFELVNL